MNIETLDLDDFDISAIEIDEALEDNFKNIIYSQPFYSTDDFDYEFRITFDNDNLILDESYEEVRDTVFTIPYEHLSVQQETYIYALNKNSNTELHVVKEKGEVTDVYFYLYDKVTQPYIKNNISSFLSLIN